MKIPIEFTSEGYQIRGKFYSAERDPVCATVLLLHGFPGNEEDVLGLGQRMSENGINVMTFNYRGTYQSEGIYSLQSTLEDISAAIEFLHQESVIHKFRIDTSELILGGWSYGGGMALAYAANHPEIRRIFSIAEGDLGEIAREFDQNPQVYTEIYAEHEALKFPTGPVRFEDFEEHFVTLMQNPDSYDLRLAAPALTNRNILLIGGWDDPFATIEHHILPVYRALMSSGAERVQIKAFQDNHTFERTREELATEIICWVKSL